MTHRFSFPGGTDRTRPDAPRPRKARSFLAVFTAILPIVLALNVATSLLPVHAVDATGQFTMDGKIEGPGYPPASTTAPFHWSDLFNASGTPILTHAMYPALLDSVFVADSATPDNTYFTSNGGGVKDISPIANWGCAPVATPTAKDDIQDAYGAVFRIPNNAPENAGHYVAYFGVERLSNNGDSFAGFWLFKDPTVSCSGTNGFTGHHTSGDLLVLTNFTNGGSAASVDLYQWVGNDATGSPVPLTTINGGNVCGATPGGANGDAACAISNAPAPGSTTRCDDASLTISSPWTPTSVPGCTFTEAAIDLTQLFGGTASGPCFSNFMAETRSSQQLTATLKDFAGGVLDTCIQPTVSTSASGNGAAGYPGSAQHDTATVGVPSGDPTPTGTLTFYLCGPSQVTSAGCPSGSGAQVGLAVTLSGGGATSTPDVTAATTPNDLATGTYCWGAQYTPDQASVDTYLPSYGTDATHECFTIAKAGPALATTASFSAGSADLSSHPAISDTATLTGAATGPAGEPAGESIGFSLFGPYAIGTTPTCAAGTNEPVFTTTGALAKSGSTYVASTASSYSPTATGTYVWTASYAGDTFNNSAGEGCNGQNESLTIVTPQLHLSKSADHATVSAGDQIGFTITVSNDSAGGTGSATGVTISDTMPGGTGVLWSIAGQDGTACTIGSSAPQTLNCNVGTLAAGASYSVHVTSATTAASCATYNNTATASATNETSGDVTAKASTTVDCPNVAVTKTADRATVNAGDPIGFNVVVSNSSAAGTGMAYNVALSDPLPAGTGISWSIDRQDGSACTISGAAGGQTLSCTIGTLAAGGTYTVHITSATQYASCAVYTNTASATVGNENGGPFTASAAATVQCPGLHVTKTTDTPLVSTGSPIHFAVTIGNSGPGTADNVTVDDPLPAGTGVDWTIASQTLALCAINGNAGSQDLQCSLGDMAPNSSYTINIASSTSASSAGTYPNTATASAGNAPSVHDSATVVVVAPDVALAKTADNTTINAGDPLGFTVTISNPGTSQTTGTATSVSISDPLPTGSGVSWSIDTQSGSACSISGTAPAAQTLTCTLTGFAPGATYDVHVTSATVFASCGMYTNTASGSVGNQNGTLSAYASTTVQCPSLTISKHADATPVSTGTDIGFSVMVSNGGPGTAYGVSVDDPLPSGSGVNWSVDAQPAQGACAIASGHVTCPLGNMTSGESLSFHVTSHTDATSAGTYPNTATASATNAPSVHDSATVVVLAPNLGLTKTADDATVSAGSPIGFTLTISNPGTSANTGTAAGLSLNDPLPGGAGVAWSIVSQGGSACSVNAVPPSQTLSCSIASFAAGATYSVHVTSGTDATSCTTYPNVAGLTARNESGTITANATTSVACPNVSVLKTADNATVSAGDRIGFQVVISNSGAAGTGAATNVSLNDPLPSGTGVSWSIDHQDGSACTVSAGTPQVVSCVIPTLAPGASYTVHVTSSTQFASCGAYPNTASVSISNEAGGPFTSSASTTVLCPNLQIFKTADLTQVSTGTPIGFLVTVTNTGVGTARNVVVDDPLPQGGGVDWLIAAQSHTLCAINGLVGHQDLQCSLGDMNLDDVYVVHITSPTDGTSAGQYPNTATASADNAPSVDSTAAILVRAPSVSITKTADDTTVSAGSPIGFTVTVSNADSDGTGTATGVTVADPLPMGTDVHWTIDQQTSTNCEITATDGGHPGEELDCMAFDLAPGGSYSVHVTTTTDLQSCGVYNNTATSTVPNQSPTTLTSDTVSATVLCPNLSITKTADSDSVTAGSAVGFTVAVTNSARDTGTASGVTIADPLPAETGVSWSISPAYSGPGTCSITGSTGSQTLSCSLGDMAPGATASVHITSSTTTSTCSPLNNTATVASGNAPSQQASAAITMVCSAVLGAATTAAVPVPTTGIGGLPIPTSAVGLIASGIMLIMGVAVRRRRTRA